MSKHWVGLDFLRGLSLFFLIVMNSAFYYYSGLWDLDLDNPPLIITIIGFLLMFAGLFAMISGSVHGISINQLINQKKWSPGQILRKKMVSGLFILVVAWLYFIFTGPGLAVFSARQMNNSILVTQLGLFLLLIVAALAVFDRKPQSIGSVGLICRFFCRFTIQRQTIHLPADASKMKRFTRTFGIADNM